MSVGPSSFIIGAGQGRWGMSWWPWGKATRRPAVVLYTRGGCHLCHEVEARLEAERGGVDFDLTIVDIDRDEEQKRLYGLEVPVVSIDGRVRFRGVVNPVLLRRALRAASEEPRTK
jgi:glutaredoxin